MAEEYRPEDTFRILIATDNHLGYAESDTERGNDSFVTFEEILSLAKTHDVDFILLGGDLFHDNKPSRFTLYRCAQLLRKYTLGDKPVQFEVLSALESTIIEGMDSEDEPTVLPNYEDPNLNVAYPVFSIHGNHDDPTGKGQMSAMDLLSVVGLVNYFGRCRNLEEIEIKPVLLQKGCTKLALYGLGAIRDERLHRIFREKKVSMVRPEEHADEWFNLLVLHQNRSKHSETSYIPDSFLENFLDLIIWGHEHECLIEPEKSYVKDFYISQPGSSVATSLAMGEAAKKQVGILHVFKQNFMMRVIPLETVRPFCFDDTALHEAPINFKKGDASAKIMEYCEAVVDRMIEKSAEQLTGENRQPHLPLVRLRVEVENEEEKFNVQRFGQKFLKKVANPRDIILFKRKKEKANEKEGSVRQVYKATEEELKKFSPVELVCQHFQEAMEFDRLEVLTENGLGKAILEFVDKSEKRAIDELVKFQERMTVSHLSELKITEENIKEELEKYRDGKTKSGEEEVEVAQALNAARNKRMTEGGDSENDMDVDEDREEANGNGEDQDWNTPSSSRGRRGGGRGSRGRGRGRGSKMNDSSAASSSTTQQKTRGGRGSRSPRTGRGRGAAKEPAQTNTLTRAFRTTRDQKKTAVDLDDEIEILDSEDDLLPRSKRSRVTPSSTTSDRRAPASSFSSHKAGVVFESDEEEL